MKLLLFGLGLICLWVTSEAATCGGSQYFEYKFKPLGVRPVGDEKKSAKKRCGEGRCDFLVMLYGQDRCKSTGHEVVLKGKKDTNTLTAGDFTPAEVGWKTHAGWRLSDASSQPFNVQLCDEDGFPRGRNDMLMHMNYNRLTKGCERVTHQDTNDPEYPYIFEFELCCRPVRNRRKRGADGYELRDRDTREGYDLRNRHTKRGTDGYELRDRDTREGYDLRNRHT